MKILLINSVCGHKSTGVIVAKIAKQNLILGHEVRIAYGRENSEIPDIETYRIGTDVDIIKHGICSRIFDNQAFLSKCATKKFVEWASKFNPDLLWIHNLHGYYIDIIELFNWIKSRPQMDVKWTLHDCWAFTGHCAHFEHIDCKRWETICFNCPLKRSYPASYVFERSKKNYELKKAAFTGVKNLEIITPSKWLAKLVKKSYLKDYKVSVIYNEIDRNIFKPVISDFRIKRELEKKYIILGVASTWSKNKGLYDFYKLSELLPPKAQIVLVGLSSKQILQIPSVILGIEKTYDVKELVEIYNAADIFFNPTYADTFPTVNLEAEACGVPVVTYSTGGAPETIHNPKSKCINVGDYYKFADMVIQQCGGKNEIY